MRYHTACLFILSFCLFPFLRGEEEIRVVLDTASPLIPIAITEVQTKEPSFSQEYVEALEAVFLFDMSHNGMTNVISKKEKPLDFAGYKKQGAFYAIQLMVKNRSLSAQVSSINSKTIKQIEPLTLSGSIDQDRRLIHTLSDNIHRLLFNKDGIASKRIIYSHRKIPLNEPTEMARWKAEIYETDYDGMNKKQLTFDQSYAVEPVFIPNLPQTLLWTSYKIGQQKLYYATTQDKTPQRLSPLRGNQFNPAVSTDGRWIAFCCDFTGTSDLFLVPFHPLKGSTAKPRQIYTERNTACSHPSFSPDGKKITFAANRDGTPKIYVMNIPEEGATIKDVRLTLISKQCRENTAPNFSPDGKKIVFCARSGGPRQIWVYDFEQDKEWALTSGPGNKENPVWAPNSLHILFDSTENGKADLYLININQPEAVKIISEEGEKRFAYWK